jgi:hypothetical protein
MSVTYIPSSNSIKVAVICYGLSVIYSGLSAARRASTGQDLYVRARDCEIETAPRLTFR